MHNAFKAPDKQAGQAAQPTDTGQNPILRLSTDDKTWERITSPVEHCMAAGVPYDQFLDEHMVGVSRG